MRGKVVLFSDIKSRTHWMPMGLLAVATALTEREFEPVIVNGDIEPN